MKVFLVTLALTIFTGSQAFVLRDESKFKVDELERELHRCFENFFGSISGKAVMVTESDIFTALDSWYSDIKEKFQQRSKALEDAIPPEVDKLERQLWSVFRDMVSKVYKEMGTVGRNVSVELEAFHEALKSDLNPILETMDPYTQPLKQSFVRTCRELDEKLIEVLKPPLEKLQPLAKEIPSKLQEVENSLNPIVDWVQRSIITELEKVHDVLHRSATQVLGVINKHRESFNQWVQSPIFPEDH